MPRLPQPPRLLQLILPHTMASATGLSRTLFHYSSLDTDILVDLYNSTYKSVGSMGVIAEGGGEISG